MVVRHNRDVHLLEDTCKAAALRGGSPSGDSAGGALGVLLHAGRQANCGNVGSHAYWSLEGEHANVVVDVPAVVVLVQTNVRHSERCLVRIVLVEVVASHLNSKLGCEHAVTAVSGSDDLVGSNDRSSAHQAATDSTGQHDLVGELSRVGISASNNPASTPGQGS